MEWNGLEWTGMDYEWIGMNGTPTGMSGYYHENVALIIHSIN